MNRTARNGRTVSCYSIPQFQATAATTSDKVVDVDRLDLDELSILNDQPTIAALLASLKSLNTSSVVRFLREQLPEQTPDELLDALTKCIAACVEGPGSTALLAELREETEARVRSRNRHGSP
jgi:hypothetical protein